MLKLPVEWQRAIRIEGEKAYPDECCGILLGELDAQDNRRVKSIICIKNARESAEMHHRYRIEPEDLLRAEKTAKAQNLEVLGFYHSHPDHAARPSEYDQFHAFPFYSYVIVSVIKAQAAELTAWRLTDDRQEFFAETIKEENMAITIQIPTALRNFTDRQAEVQIDGETVGDAIAALTDRYADLRQHLYDGNKLRSFINIFVGETNIKELAGVDTKLTGGETIMLVPAIAGGAA